MNPTFALLAAGWLESRYLIWSSLLFGTILTVGIAIYVFRNHRPAALALIRHPFAKYVIFSIVAHLGLAAWLWTSHWFDSPPLPPGATTVIVEVGGDQEPPAIQPSKPWDAPQTEVASGTVPPLPEPTRDLPEIERPAAVPAFDNRVESPLADLDSIVADVADTKSPFADAPKPPTDATEFDSSVPDPVAPFDEPLADLKVEPKVSVQDKPRFSANSHQQAPAIDEAPNINSEETAVLSRDEDAPATSPEIRPKPEFTNPIPPIQVAETPQPTKPKARLQRVSSKPRAARTLTVKRRSDGKALPAIYRDRWAEDRMAIGRMRGGGEDTEAAVLKALTWLAQAQAANGSWDASQFGSGKPVLEGGHDRGNAGIRADTATTGLALLAFLGSGHTHLEGKYADNVQRGLAFLVRAQRQRRDGSLVGEATGYAAMYCHGIATLAVSEAYSLTGDVGLQRTLSDAINFTLSAQHPGGGWRYRPQEPGDTSQLGWQLMAVTSAHYAGYAKIISGHPNNTWASASRFLDSVAWGSNKGLASYKPNQRPTRPMTAEAMLCRLLLNTPTDHPRILEAANHLMGELPGQGRLNYYYWYYGTLGLYHLQDDHWVRWNQALKRQLTATQNTDGSWPTENSIWGNAGGKVYTTAIAAMTLEVYYRYRPFSETHRVDRTARRP